MLLWRRRNRWLRRKEQGRMGSIRQRLGWRSCRPTTPRAVPFTSIGGSARLCGSYEGWPATTTSMRGSAEIDCPRQWVHALHDQQGSPAIVAGFSRVTSSFANNLRRLLVIVHGVEKRKSPPNPGGDSPCVRGQSQLRHCFARGRRKYESSPAGNDDHQDGRSTN